jgi:hypothetical protein
MVRITFQDLKINEISQSSGVFSGNNAQMNWKHVARVNEGQGVISGDHNVVTRSIHAICRKPAQTDVSKGG